MFIDSSLVASFLISLKSNPYYRENEQLEHYYETKKKNNFYSELFFPANIIAT